MRTACNTYSRSHLILWTRVSLKIHLFDVAIGMTLKFWAHIGQVFGHLYSMQALFTTAGCRNQHTYQNYPDWLWRKHSHQSDQLAFMNQGIWLGNSKKINPPTWSYEHQLQDNMVPVPECLWLAESRILSHQLTQLSVFMCTPESDWLATENIHAPTWCLFQGLWLA